MAKLIKSLKAMAGRMFRKNTSEAADYDFAADGLYYKIVSLADLTCAVTSGDGDYTGNIVIPREIVCNDRKLTVTGIDQSAFSRNMHLKSVTLPDTIENIGAYAFYCCMEMKNVNIPASVRTIGMNSFSKCTGLTEIVIPDSVIDVGEYAFKQCFGLKSVHIGTSVVMIDYYAFYYCTGLKELVIHDSDKPLVLNNYNGGAFRHCTVETIYLGRNCSGKLPVSNMREIIYGKNIRKISSQSLSTCTELYKIYLQSAVPPEGADCFSNRQYMNIIVYVPKGSLKAYKAADGWRNFWNLRESDAVMPDHVTESDSE